MEGSTSERTNVSEAVCMAIDSYRAKTAADEKPRPGRTAGAESIRPPAQPAGAHRSIGGKNGNNDEAIYD